MATCAGHACLPINKKKLPGIAQDIWHKFVGNYWHHHMLWKHGFRKFDDKSKAINLATGQIDGDLAALIMDCCLRDEILIVGRPGYKSIIEDKLRLACVYNERVMEVMWGMQNLMPFLHPEESAFTKADRLPICKGLDMLLSRHGFHNVKQEMLNQRILDLARMAYQADLREREHSRFLHGNFDKKLKAISGFDAKDWDLLKLATALKSMVDPDGTRLTLAEYNNMFSPEEVELIFRDAPKYEDLIDSDTISKIHSDVVTTHAYRVRVLLKLGILVKKAEAALKTEDVLEKAAINGVDSMQQVGHTCLG